MQFYIIKKEDTLDKILNNYGLTYQKFISLNGSNIKELIKNKDLVHKIEDLREEDSNLNEIVNRLQKCKFTKKELDRIKDLYEKYFGIEEEKTEEEKIAEKFAELKIIPTFASRNGLLPM